MTTHTIPEASGIGSTYDSELTGSRAPRNRFWTLIAVALLCASQNSPGWSWGASQDSSNAAHDYRRAFAEIARPPDTGRDLPGPNEPLLRNSENEQLVAQLGPALERLHEATSKQHCDWENDLPRKGAAADFPHLAKSRELAQRALFRARYYWQSDKQHQAIKDVHAVLVLARRVGDEGRTGLVGLTERYKIEQTVVDVLRQWVADVKSARPLDSLCLLALQPEGNLPKAGLLLERETILPWTRRLVTGADLTTEEQQWRDKFFGEALKAHGAKWILQRVDETKVHYTEVGDLLDLPMDQFVPRFRQYIGKLDGAGNPFSQVAIVQCPGIPGAYLQSKNLRAQWTILRAALIVLQRGPTAMKEIRDPYGDGPFKYESLADGFTIRSALPIDGKLVELRFTRDVPGQQPSGSPR